MTAVKSEFLQVMTERGFIHQCTNQEALDQALGADRITGYIGFDCTAPSLHVGSLIQLMVLRWMQKTGHKPVVLLGGGTTRVGDPSGKDESRKILDDSAIDRNMQSIAKSMKQFISFGGEATDAILVDNAEWLSGLNYIEFLRDVGPHFSINRMLTQDSVRMRLEREQNLSFLEFNYMVLQAYDFFELHRRYNCRLQIGGSDQWGNIIMGLELDRRMSTGGTFKPIDVKPERATTGGKAEVLEVQPMIKSSGHNPENYSPEHFMSKLKEEETGRLFGLTTPLLTTSSGAKMGKTADGAVWLDRDFLSPYEYWQFWRNTEDADVGRFLRLFTELPLDEITKLDALNGAEINEAKKILANEATRICHGERAAKRSEETARKTFEEGATGEDLPEFVVTREQIGKGMPAYEVFRLAELVASGGEAKRLIRGGGAKINDKKIVDEQMPVTQDIFASGPIKLSAGRKRHATIRME